MPDRYLGCDRAAILRLLWPLDVLEHDIFALIRAFLCRRLNGFISVW
jgi:hypothetical protein